jgi:hypothetical protein
MEAPYRKDCNQGLAHVHEDLFQSERLGTNTKFPLYRTLFWSVKTYQYACPTWEHAPDDRTLKLQRLQNRAIRAIGKLDDLDRRPPVQELYVTFKIPYMYGYI